MYACIVLYACMYACIYVCMYSKNFFALTVKSEDDENTGLIAGVAVSTILVILVILVTIIAIG